MELTPPERAVLEACLARGWIQSVQVELLVSQRAQLAQEGRATPIGALLAQGYLSPAQVAELRAVVSAPPPVVHDDSVTVVGSARPTSGRSPGLGTRGDSGDGSLVGRVIDGYRIEGELGRGGMGVVYRAVDVELGRPVAFKTLLLEAATGTGALERFRIEGESAGRLNHPGIVQVHRAGEIEGQAYLVMDLVDGESLQDRLKRDGHLDEREAVQVALGLAEALEFAHQAGVIHRDVKPDNVLLPADGSPPRLTDFGLARINEGEKLTQAGAMIGTPAYMPPEQADGDLGAIGPGSDGYSLGATLYAMLTGRPPFKGGGAFQIVKQVLTDEPEPPSRHQRGLDPQLDLICLTCLEKEPKDRYASLAALAEDLGRWQRGEPLAAQPPPRKVLVRRWLKRNRVKVAFGAVLLLGLASVGVSDGAKSFFQARLKQLQRFAQGGRAATAEAADLRKEMRKRRRRVSEWISSLRRDAEPGQLMLSDVRSEIAVFDEAEAKRAKDSAERVKERGVAVEKSEEEEDLFELDKALQEWKTSANAGVTLIEAVWAEGVVRGAALESERSEAKAKVKALGERLNPALAQELREGSARVDREVEKWESALVEIEREVTEGLLLAGEVGRRAARARYDLDRKRRPWSEVSAVDIWEGALANASRVIERAPQDPRGWALRGKVRRQLALRRIWSDKHDKVALFREAVGDLGRWLELAPKTEKALDERGTALREMGDTLSKLGKRAEAKRAWEASSKDLNAWLGLNPGDYEAFHQVATNLGRQGRREEAVEVLTRAKKLLRGRLDPLADLLEVRGGFYVELGRAEEAITDLSFIVDTRKGIRSPPAPDIRLQRSRAYRLLGRWKNARDDVVAGLNSSKPRSRAEHYSLLSGAIEVLVKLRQIKPALEYVDEWKRKSSSTPKWKAGALAYRALLRLEQGREDKARDDLEKSFRHGPDPAKEHVDLITLQARLLFRLEDYDRAREQVDFGLIHSEDDPDLRRIRAELRRRRGDKDGALRDYDVALRFRPVGPERAEILERIKSLDAGE